MEVTTERLAEALQGLGNQMLTVKERVYNSYCQYPKMSLLDRLGAHRCSSRFSRLRPNDDAKKRRATATSPADD